MRSLMTSHVYPARGMETRPNPSSVMTTLATGVEGRCDKLLLCEADDIELLGRGDAVFGGVAKLARNF
jgi:hypothetical protein